MAEPTDSVAGAAPAPQSTMPHGFLQRVRACLSYLESDLQGNYAAVHPDHASIEQTFHTIIREGLTQGGFILPEEFDWQRIYRNPAYHSLCLPIIQQTNMHWQDAEGAEPLTAIAMRFEQLGKMLGLEKTSSLIQLDRYDGTLSHTTGKHHPKS